MQLQTLISSFLLLNKICALPKIGILQLQMMPAKVDMANKLIVPPGNNIDFIENNSADPGKLVNYIAYKKNIQPRDAMEELNKFCSSFIAKMDAGEQLHLGSIGWLQKNKDGHIYFEGKKNNNYWQPVSAERVLHLDASHNVLVGDKETTSALMNEYYNGEVVVEKSHWAMWAIILFAIGLLVLFFYFNSHSFSTEGIGNQKHLIIKEPEQTNLKYQNK